MINLYIRLLLLRKHGYNHYLILQLKNLVNDFINFILWEKLSFTKKNKAQNKFGLFGKLGNWKENMEELTLILIFK